MAHLQYLVFNNENIPMPASYSVSLSDVEADSGGVTEAGTTQRDVVREGVVQIGVTFRVSKKWLNKFSAYKKLASITVGYLDMETMNIVDTQMYIDGYQVKLVSDTSYGYLIIFTFTKLLMKQFYANHFVKSTIIIHGFKKRRTYRIHLTTSLRT